MRALFDTIVAPITGLQSAAVAVIRLSGPDSWLIASHVFSPWPSPVTPRYALYGRFIHGDDGIALPFEEGRSFTGEQTVEFSLHGSPASVRAFIESCRQAGARDARPGEFTERAFLNGRIDLTQAEAVRDTVEAQTSGQLKRAHRLRDGALRTKFQIIRDELVSVLASVEASVDFSEEIGDFDRAFGIQRLASVTDSLNALLATAESGRIVREGLTIALVGLPNAGKSSLLNALLKSDRAIVTPIPGTTRDTLEESVELGGVLVRLIDTAGIRQTEDVVEREGVRRTLDAALNADRVWHLFDSQTGWQPGDEFVGPADLILATKSDLADAQKGQPVSVVTGEGLRALEDWVASQAPNADESIHTRHVPEIETALRGVALAIETFDSELPFDLATVGLQDALHALGTITGESATTDLLERLFRDFCIGK